MHEVFAGLFSDPTWIAFDFLRLFVMVAGAVIIGLFVSTANSVGGQRRWGMYSLACFALVAVGSQPTYFGHQPTYRLPFVTAGCIFGLMFHLHKETTMNNPVTPVTTTADPNVTLGNEKLYITIVITFIGGLVTLFVSTFPDNNDVQLWGGIIAGILTLITNAVAVFYKAATLRWR